MISKNILNKIFINKKAFGASSRHLTLDIFFCFLIRLSKIIAIVFFSFFWINAKRWWEKLQVKLLTLNKPARDEKSQLSCFQFFFSQTFKCSSDQTLLVLSSIEDWKNLLIASYNHTISPRIISHQTFTQSIPHYSFHFILEFSTAWFTRL